MGTLNRLTVKIVVLLEVTSATLLALLKLLQYHQLDYGIL